MNELKEIETDSLTPHPKNIEIYGDNQSIIDLIPSIEEHGIKRHLIIDQDNQIIDGVRRWLTATHIGISKVLCERKHYDSDEAVVDDILLYNKYRIKTDEQIYNEGQALKQKYTEEAKKRMLKGKLDPGATADPGRTAIKVASDLGFGATKWKELSYVYTPARQEEFPDIVDKAKKEIISTHKAYKMMRDKMRKEEGFQEKKTLFVNTINRIKRKSLREALLNKYRFNEIVKETKIEKLNEEIRRALGRPVGETFEAIWQQLNKSLVDIAKRHGGNATLRRWYLDTSRFITVTIRLDEQDAKPKLELEHFKDNMFVDFEEADAYAEERGGYCEGKAEYGALEYWRLWIHPSFLEKKEEEK